MAMDGFETVSARMEALFLVVVQTPAEDVDRIMEHVTAIIPLLMGPYDNNAFQSAAGIERYRPLEGAEAGPETEVRRRPGVVQVGFHLPRDQTLLTQVVEAIFTVHSYQEPWITVQEILVSHSKGLDDKDNPNRWWNRGGDWKTREDASSPTQEG